VNLGWDRQRNEGILQRHSQGCVEAPRGPKDLSVALSDPMTASRLAAYSDEASPFSRTYSTACLSGVRTDNTLKVRFSATLGEKPEIKVTLV
jgi:hypothetical protein